MRFLRFLFISFAAVLALIVSVYLVVNVAGVISAHHKRNALGAQITDRIGEELAGSRSRAGDVADVAGAEPAHSWAAQQCGFETNDGGWIVQDYREVCSLESAHAWPVDSESEAFALVGSQLPPGAEPFVSGPCHTINVSGESYGDGVSILYMEPSTQGDRWCEPTDRSSTPRRAISDELPDLDYTQGWLVVVDTRELVDEVIGCTHWSVLFCGNPFGDELAWGEPA